MGPDDKAPEPSSGRRVAIIGTGRAGSALGLSLLGAGAAWGCGLVSRPGSGAERAEFLGLPWLGTSDEPGAWLGSTDILLLAVRDAEVGPLAEALALHAGWEGKVALHLSGSQGSAILVPLARAGAIIGSLHPLVSLAARADGRPVALPQGVPFFGEGEPEAMRLGRELSLAVGGSFAEIASEDKAIYHAGATIAGNLAAVMHAAGGDVLRMLGAATEAASGLPERALLPLVRASTEAVAAHGGIGGLTGPLSRGDVATLAANIEALRAVSPSLRRAHAAVSLLGLDLLERAGKAPPHQAEMRALLHQVLDELAHRS